MGSHHSRSAATGSPEQTDFSAAFSPRRFLRYVAQIGSCLLAGPGSSEHVLDGENGNDRPYSTSGAFRGGCSSTVRLPGTSRRFGISGRTARKSLSRGRTEGVGHRITGDRRGASEGLGYDFLHVAIDDATWLACVEVSPDERRWPTIGFSMRALRWFNERGVVREGGGRQRLGLNAGLFRKMLRILGHPAPAPIPRRRNASSRPCCGNGPTRPPSVIAPAGHRPAATAGLVQPAPAPRWPRTTITGSSPRRNNRHRIYDAG